MTFSEKVKLWFSKVFGTTPPVEEPGHPPVENPATGYKMPSMSDFGKKQKWIPWAERNPEGIQTPTRGTFARGYPEGVIIHFTDGWSTPPRQSAINTLRGGVSDGYTYLVMDRNGVIYQGFPLDKWGYHSGTKHNQTCIGIEHCNMGQVKKIADNKWGSKEQPGMKEYWTDADVRKVSEKDNMHAGTYLKFTQAQEKSLVELILWLAVNSGLGISFIDNVLGHDEVAPDRRDDPGGALSMSTPEFRSFLKSLYRQIV